MIISLLVVGYYLALIQACLAWADAPLTTTAPPAGTLDRAAEEPHIGKSWKEQAELPTLNPGRTQRPPVTDARECQKVETLLKQLGFALPNVPEIALALDQQLAELSSRGLIETYCHELRVNLENKALAQQRGLQLSSNLLLNTAIKFERFRLNGYLDSAVAPKRYFGFVDESGDTAAYERELRTTIIRAVAMTNAFAQRKGLRSRITEKAVLITFLAEGGSLVLSNPEFSPDRIHPVTGVGLDNFRLGFRAFPELLGEFDQFFDTRLQQLEIPTPAGSLLLRPMTFREAVLGTTIMYLYESELTVKHLSQNQRAPLNTLSDQQQFIIVSLMYNAGLLFSQERVEQIEHFSTGEYLWEIHLKSKRPPLPIVAPRERQTALKSTPQLPQQGTSWSAVYHILQRYGAWIALEKYGTAFTGTNYSRRDLH